MLLAVLLGGEGVQAFGEACDLVTCTCDGVSLAHIRDRVYISHDDSGVGESIAVKICDPFTAEQLEALSSKCDQYVASESPTALRFGNSSCEVLGAVAPCPFANGRCGMNASKTVPAPKFAPEVYSLDVRYEYSSTTACVRYFGLEMDMAVSLEEARAATLEHVRTPEGALCDERVALLPALLPPAAGPGDDDDNEYDGNCTMPADRGPNPPTEQECAQLWDDNCDTDGLINYLSVYYCELGYAKYHLELWRTLALGFILLWLFVLFMMLGSTADDFFSPALIVLADKMNLSQRTAGVTLLALGNGAPDLFSVVSSIHPSQGEPEIGLALGDLTGGGNFVVTVVLSALLVVVRPNGLRAEGMFLRDALFYAGSVMFVYAIMLYGEVTLVSSLLFFCGYVGYCFVVIVVGPRTPPCLSTRREAWKLSRGLSSDLHEPLAHSDHRADMRANNDEGDEREGGDRTGGLTLAEGQALLNSVLGETVDRIAQANVADIPGTATALLEEAGKVQGMWMALTGWEEKSMVEKVIYLLEAPFTVLRWISIPPVLYDTDEMESGAADGASSADDDDDGADEWAHALERPLTAVSLPGFTSFFLFYMFQAQIGIWPTAFGEESCTPAEHLKPRQQAAATLTCPGLVDDDAGRCQSDSHCVYHPPGMSVWLLVTLCSFVVIPPVVWKCTNSVTRPPAWFKLILLFFAFMSSMFWMDLVAGEAVAVLKSLGLMWRINMAVLGLTVLAWGNSIGDLVADVSVARAGSPDMAVTACFAGPLFNMLVGLGVAFFIQCAYTKKPVPINLAGDTWKSLHVSFIGLSSILCATCVAAVCRSYRLQFWWAFALGGYYCVYMIAEATIALAEHE